MKHAPEYPSAWAGLGDAYAVLGFYDYLPPAEPFPKAQEAARRALEQYRLTLELDSDFELAYLWSGWALEALGRYDEALAMLDEAVTRSRGSAISTASLARVQALRGEREEAERILTKLLSSDGYLPAYEISKAWLALGASNQADKWLQRAFEQRSHSLVFLHVDPQLKNHQEDPALQRIAARVRM